MSKIDIIRVTTKKERKAFAHFGNELYKGNEYAVPDLEFDVLNTFDPKKNAASSSARQTSSLQRRTERLSDALQQ